MRVIVKSISTRCFRS